MVGAPFAKRPAEDGGEGERHSLEHASVERHRDVAVGVAARQVERHQAVCSRDRDNEKQEEQVEEEQRARDHDDVVDRSPSCCSRGPWPGPSTPRLSANRVMATAKMPSLNASSRVVLIVAR